MKKTPPPPTQEAIQSEVSKLSNEDMIQLRAKWSIETGLGPNPTSQFGAPVSFTAHLDGLLPGHRNVPLSTSGLANGYRTPYIIDEIRMQAYMTEPVSSGNVLQPSFAVSFLFRTGAYKFSEKAVPMILHQPNYCSTHTPSLNVPGPVLESTWGGGLTTLGDEARWLLAKPLWMGPGDQIQAEVSRDRTAASLNDSPFSVDVTYVGRSLKQGATGPRIRYVPWVAHYVHDFADSFSQTTTEFRNPFTYPLTIQKLIGRPMSKAANGGFTTGRLNMLPDQGGNQYAGIYMEDSLGYKITRSAIDGEFSPVGSVFDTERCQWTFARPIGPNEQLNMHFQTLGTVAATNRIFGVAMHGYREETA